MFCGHVVTDCRDYAVPDVTKSALKVALPPVLPPQVPRLDLAPPTYDALYAAADVVSQQNQLNIPNLQVTMALESKHDNTIRLFTLLI